MSFLPGSSKNMCFGSTDLSGASCFRRIFPCSDVSDARYDFKDIHRTCSCTFTAHDTLESRLGVFRFAHHTERTGFNTVAAAVAQLLIDHVDSHLVLDDRIIGAGIGTFAALYTDDRPGIKRRISL